MALQNLITGASLVLYINGIVVGFATGITFTRSQAIKSIYELDNPYVAEMMPTQYSIDGTLNGLRIRQSSGIDTNGIMDLSSVSMFFDQKYVNIELLDRLTGVRIYSIQRCIFSTDSWSIQNRGILSFSASFRGTFLANEKTV